ncbi:Hypothetical protein SCV20265_4026 [Pseudomonas aeruginosa SCV20265]|nr:Hypothetical protein SCV20265_4026 [Pseudomonas aeruginosa SCV20265]
MPGARRPGTRRYRSPDSAPRRPCAGRNRSAPRGWPPAGPGWARSPAASAGAVAGCNRAPRGG